jgi:hypothetical protein
LDCDSKKNRNRQVKGDCGDRRRRRGRRGWEKEEKEEKEEGMGSGRGAVAATNDKGRV